MIVAVEERDDVALLTAARAREAPEAASAAFRALFLRYKDEVFTFVARVVREDSLAEDATQDAFVRLHSSLAAFDARLAFRPWLFEIARNAALDALRRQAKQARFVERERAAQEGAPLDEPVLPEVERRESAAAAREALAALSEETRALLVQRHGHGAKLSELADSFSCTERTIRNRLRAAAAQLAQALFERRARPIPADESAGPSTPKGGRS